MFAADVLHPNITLQDKLTHIYTLKKGSRIDLTIRPEYLILLDRLGNPHRNLPPVIHVAGTNGKGSTIAYMRAIFEAAGYRVHAYTSPHLIRFNERIVLAGTEIDDTTLEFLLDETLAANDGMEQTFFEITTALALTAFSRVPADIVLLETGLGGRLDSTNVIDHPLATVITTLSYDHTEFLGTTIQSIAMEKAGIMKPETPCIVAAQTYQDVLPVFTARAKELRAPLHMRADTTNIANLPPPSLLGAHQQRNAATAVSVMQTQTRFKISEAALAQGLRSAVWPARLQRLNATPVLPPGWELWLDGGHNDSAAEALATQIRTWAAQDGKPLYIVTGMMAHKDAAAFARPLAPLAAGIVVIPVGPENSFPPAALAALWQQEGAAHVQTVTTPWPAPLKALQTRPGPGRVLVTGSLYLAGLFI